MAAGAARLPVRRVELPGAGDVVEEDGAAGAEQRRGRAPTAAVRRPTCGGGAGATVRLRLWCGRGQAATAARARSCACGGGAMAKLQRRRGRGRVPVARRWCGQTTARPGDGAARRWRGQAPTAAVRRPTSGVRGATVLRRRSPTVTDEGPTTGAMLGDVAVGSPFSLFHFSRFIFFSL